MTGRNGVLAMTEHDRRSFLRRAGIAGSLATLPSVIRDALAVQAAQAEGTIADVKHVVILMQENRSFDHYFGTMRGVRGFGDRHPVPLASGKPVWHQSNGTVEVLPFHLDTAKTDALRVPGTPHSFADAQAAWAQGKFGQWPRFKTDYSMGYYKREDIPFQFALAESFTICDAYHCSVTAGTDPNRIVFWSGASFDPEMRAKGINCTDEHSEPNNWRCWVKGALPKPGYTYAGNDLNWPTIPDVLEKAGISWRVYQDPNNNWTGAMHGGLAFQSFRRCKPGDALYEKGMSHWSLDALQQHVEAGTLPAVSWVLPSPPYSEHPSASTPLQGAEFTARVLAALTANPEIWSRTALFLTFDENDGLFDHLPAAAPPSYNADGVLMGKATLPLPGHYLSDPERKHLDPSDQVSGSIRPFGLGPRVPMYVISPWSKGGWVTSEVFDHTSVGRFLEKRFNVRIPAISPWHRAVCGDLTSAFDFKSPNDPKIPELPDVGGASAVVLDHIQRPRIWPPDQPQPLFQERGVRRSRALPYELDVESTVSKDPAGIRLRFRNTGGAGAVFHVYDRNHLDRIPRRYTVESRKTLDDTWGLADTNGQYDLMVLGPNGFRRDVSGSIAAPVADVEFEYRPSKLSVRLTIKNRSSAALRLEIIDNAYGRADTAIDLGTGKSDRKEWPVAESGRWYDVTVKTGAWSRRFAGRMEDGSDSTSDPAMGA